MKRLIRYYDVRGDSVFSFPEFSTEETVSVKSQKDLDTYILSKKDMYGNPFQKKSSFGFDYISNQGAVKVRKLVPTKKIS